MLKKLSALLLILSIGIVSAFAADSALYVKEKTHNFGTIREADGPVRCEFILQNNGDKPLVIVSAKHSADALRPAYPSSRYARERPQRLP